MRKTAMLAALPLLLASCAWLEPDLVLPKFRTADRFTVDSPSPTLAFVNPGEVGSWQVAQARVAEPRGNWWEMYNDPQLDALMQEALANSPSLEVMAARVKQARANLGLADSQFFPMVYATGGATRRQMAPADIQQPDSSHVSPQTTYTAQLQASYELDLFGRISGEARQARFSSLASKDLYESAKLSLQADVVQAYYAARTGNAVLADISETLALGERNLKLAKRQHELGDISSQSYQQTVADLMNLRNDALTVQQQQMQAQNRLAYLLGRMPGGVVVSDTAAVAELPPLVPAGIPANLLERRPDIAAAQNQLAAANAGIGVARAAFFPSLSLTGSVGHAAQDFDNLFKSSTRTWAVGPALTLPIFQGATNLSRLRYNWGVYEEAVGVYKQQVLAAFQEVNDALAAHRISLEQASGQQQAAEELGKTSGMATRQYELGDISQLEMIASRQQALVARINGQRALLNAYNASAQLVRALGGGWAADPRRQGGGERR